MPDDRAERKAIEPAFMEDELGFRQIVECISQVFYVTDSARRILYASPAFERLWGHSVELLYRGPLSWLDLVHPEDRQRVADAIKQKSGSGQYEFEYRFTTADGAVRWVMSQSTEIYAPDGSLHRVVGVATDITQRRELEQQLRQSQKMEAVGGLAGGIAHDFNNLLTVIVANATHLRESLAPDSAHAQRAIEIEDAVMRAADLTKKLLGFSRHAILTLKPIVLGEILNEVAGILRHTLDPRIEVVVEQAQAADLVLADPIEMSHAVMNFCLNGRDAMPEGGRLTLRTGRTVVDAVQARRTTDARPGEFVFLSVEDNGHGIAPEALPRIFEPFFTTKPVGKGTGLGLAVAFGMVKQHQGWIECSTSLAGTKFTVYLPRHTREHAGVASESKPPSMPVARSGETILFVDDEDLIRSVGKVILEKQGYRVILAADGVEAVATYERENGSIDLVILDLTMPQLAGRDVLPILQRIRPDVRVVFCTGQIGDGVADPDDAMSTLQKPYTAETLASAVRHALDRGR
jgi:two-component system, cell cycle sensor histidine kinase and response regulator CckA